VAHTFDIAPGVEGSEGTTGLDKVILASLTVNGPSSLEEITADIQERNESRRRFRERGFAPGDPRRKNPPLPEEERIRIGTPIPDEPGDIRASIRRLVEAGKVEVVEE
jgi:hypothetical protein